MTRLTNHIREKMADALVRHRFADEGVKLAQKGADLFDAAYDQWYSPKVRQHMAAILKANGADSFATKVAVEVNAGGPKIQVGSVQVGYSNARWSVDVKAKPVLDDLDGYNRRINLDREDPLAARVTAFGMAVDIFKKSVETARAEALGALNQFNTGKALRQTWPEALSVIGDLIPEDERSLPTVTVDGLNSKFGLPASDA